MAGDAGLDGPSCLGLSGAFQVDLLLAVMDRSSVRPESASAACPHLCDGQVCGGPEPKLGVAII